MSSQNLFGLPTLPLELKSLSPFMQRAYELKNKEPIIAYWCLYHAAQVGLAIKPSSAAFLSALLNVLERMKETIGPQDAMNVDSVAIAYVENFALRVFTAADEEDRSGEATRSTAKKFLAAANFLEVLHIFPDISESNEEKIKYAKWKAADIAKAFREGREPAPGPPNSKPQPSSADIPSNVNLSESTHPSADLSDATPTPNGPPSPPPPQGVIPSPPRTPPPHISVSGTGHGPGERAPSPGSWSTFATPGGKRDAWAESPSNSEDGKMPGIGKKTVRFTPSTTGAGDSPPSSGLAPSPSASSNTSYSDPFSIPSLNLVTTEPGSGATATGNGAHLHSPQFQGNLQYDVFGYLVPTNDTRQVHEPSEPTGYYRPPPPPPYPNPQEQLPSQQSFSSPHHSSPPATTTPSYSSPASVFQDIPPTLVEQSTVPVPPFHYPQMQAQTQPAVYSAPQPPVTEIELTPMLISKTQKHCRFAISALDYEDVETARRELKAALALLEVKGAV